MSSDRKHLVIRDVLEATAVDDPCSKDKSPLSTAMVCPTLVPKLSDLVKLVSCRITYDLKYGHGKHHKRLMFKSKAVAEKCFNLLTEHDTLSLECKTVLQRKRWGDSLTAMIRISETDKRKKKNELLL